MIKTIIHKTNTQIRYLEVESALVVIDLECIAISCSFRGDAFILFLLHDGNKNAFRKTRF